MSDAQRKARFERAMRRVNEARERAYRALAHDDWAEHVKWLGIERARWSEFP